MFQGIDVDAGAGAALQLFASFGGENNQTIFRVDLRRLSSAVASVSSIKDITVAAPHVSNKVLLKQSLGHKSSQIASLVFHLW